MSDWSELSARGLRRVYIGMESGHDPLLDWLNKPGDATESWMRCGLSKAAT